MPSMATRIEALNIDERAILDRLLTRLEAGRTVYGPWNVDDGRDYRKESLEEIVDALHYCAAQLVRHRREQAARPQRVYVCHPFADAPVANEARVREIARGLFDEGIVAIAPHLYLPHIFDEQTQRHLALDACLQLVEMCDQVRVYGKRVTPGMQREIEHAQLCRIPVVSASEVRS
jgi:hypothetical protein